jgi:dihydrofolate synthase/folylpolyglutamate synthase
MSYTAAIRRLYALVAELYTPPGEARRKFDLDQMRTLMHALGDPQKGLRSVLIAGTNGKGSTAATLAAICAVAGYRVGLYTSPHLARVNERIQILEGRGPGMDPVLHRQEIEDEAFAGVFDRVEACSSQLVSDGRLPAPPSFFEALTAMAFLFFAEEKVDIVVLEVGMGGRLDATNIVEPMLSIITDISLDHTEWLGPTVGAIAREKAGILREHGTMVTLPQHPEANQVLGEIAVPLGVKAISAAQYVPPPLRAQDDISNHYSVDIEGAIVQVDSPLAGRHQQRNLALAIAAAVELRNSHGYILSNDAISIGIRHTSWPGRLELYPAKGSRAAVLLDVGHNPAGAWALRSALSQWPENGSARTLIFSCLRDKPVGELAKILFPLFDRVILTTIDSPRAASLKEMSEAAEPAGTTVETSASPMDAMDMATWMTPAAGLIVVTGSVLLVGAIRSMLEAQGTRNVRHEPEWNQVATPGA